MAALELLQAQTRERLELARGLSERLDHLARTLRAREAPRLSDLLETLDTMSSFESLYEKYYTPEQLAQLATRRDEFGPGGMQDAQRSWGQLYTDAQAAAEAGLDPAGPQGRDLVARKRALIEAFTGGDAGIEQSLRRMYAENPGARQAVAGEAGAMDFLRRAEGAAQED